MKVPEAMKLTNFSVDQVPNLSLRCQSLKAHALGSLPPTLPQPDRAEQCLNRAINDEGVVVKPGSHVCVIACDSFSLAALVTPCNHHH